MHSLFVYTESTHSEADALSTRLSTFSTLSWPTLVRFSSAKINLFTILKQSKILMGVHSKTSFRVTQGHRQIVEGEEDPKLEEASSNLKKIRRS